MFIQTIAELDHPGTQPPRTFELTVGCPWKTGEYPGTDEMNEIEVVGAVIVADGRVLAARRSEFMSLPGYWEFPGGKVEAGEPPQVALVREINEELCCAVEAGPLITTTRYEYDFGVVQLTTFWASLLSGVPSSSEHSELRWCEPSELGGLDWAPADRPAVEQVEHQLS